MGSGGERELIIELKGAPPVIIKKACETDSKTSDTSEGILSRERSSAGSIGPVGDPNKVIADPAPLSTDFECESGTEPVARLIAEA